MLCKTYKNGSITVRHEQFFDGDMPESFHAFPAWLAENEDGFDFYEIGDFSYGAYPAKIFVNGELGYYSITPDDFRRYLTGKTVRFKRESLAPLFTLPTFYKYADGVEWEGMKGSMYWMASPLTDEQREELSWGCVRVLSSHCEYAPEIRSDVVFVQSGTPFDFC